MDARFSDEHEQIKRTTREFFEDAGGIEFARRRLEGERAVVPELWADVSEMEFPLLTIPEEHDGLGEGMVYLTALLEEFGRYAAPGPFPETMAFCVPLIAAGGSQTQQEEVFSDVITDSTKLSFALYDDPNEEPPDAIHMGVEEVSDGFRLSGTKTLVPYGGEVDRILLAARTRNGDGFEGISLFLVDAAAASQTELQSIDRTRPMYELEFSDVVVEESALVGPLHEGGDLLSQACDRYNIAICGMLVGGAARVIDLCVEFGNTRTQYGQPIGRFQAVKHRLADMWIQKELARSLTYYASTTVDDETQDSAMAVSMMKAFVAGNFPDLFVDGIKTYGGQGFTWENDVHIYLKQAKAWQQFVGSEDYHLDRLADLREYADRTLPEYPTVTIPPYQ